MSVLAQSLGPSAFDRLESNVRYYCRRLPRVLQSAVGAVITDTEGRRYVDLMSACGALNYGHAHPDLKEAAMSFLARDGISAALDFHTDTKLDFIEEFERSVLRPRDMDYVMQFPGPTGANCVEAALKLARKVTGRRNVVAFTNGFHGVSMGALAATGSRHSRRSSIGSLHDVVRLPYEGFHGAGIQDLRRFEAMATDPSGGVDPIAAIIVETVQGEGGLNVGSAEWLAELSNMSSRLGALLVVDDIQAGCGRTGSFFSFDGIDLRPDMVCLAKSISGYGFPMSLLLIDRKSDFWEPAEHNGTFRGNSIAIATATASLRLWTAEFVAGLALREARLRAWCTKMERRHAGVVRAKGRGMMQGLAFSDAKQAAAAANEAVQRGILLECCGPSDEVLKIMAPLNIDVDLFRDTLDQLADIIGSVLESPPTSSPSVVPASGPEVHMTSKVMIEHPSNASEFL